MLEAPDTARLTGLLAGLIGALVLSRFVSQKLVPFLAKSNKEDLSTIRDLLATGKVTPVIVAYSAGLGSAGALPSFSVRIVRSPRRKSSRCRTAASQILPRMIGADAA